ncbi:Rpn family recombination-promoting nuclease/putative transposase [Salibacterium lacus]|uniref:Rpn family recombination-promoting nuclease/putative transposase n=1 Tax=Salibacterium lacus TaxID=1898109 RepID=A0ABW5T405_9BACI
MTIDHDRLFKEILTTYFEEFIALFFPKVHEAVDFSEIQFLPEEVFSDVTQGEKYKVDVLAKTKLKDEETVIIIHTESQSYPQRDFNERMFIYYGRLYEKYRCRILPIALFTYDQKRSETDEFTIRFPFHDVLHFQFLMIQLKQQNWRQFIHTGNPAAAALLSKMGYNEKEKVQVKKEFLRMMVHMHINRAHTTLLTGFFETYLKLTSSEEQLLKEEVKMMRKPEGDKVMEIMVSYEKEGLDKGLEQGKKQGKEMNKIETATAMLKKDMDVPLIAEITGLPPEDILRLKDK